MTKLDAANTAWMLTSSVLVLSGVMTLLLLKLSDAVAGMRVAAEQESEGLDTVLHNEKGYTL